MKYSGSPFGKMSGAIAGQVTASWKGIDYARAYTVPNNPKTTDQTLQRTIFKNVSAFGRRVVDTVLNPFTIPAPKLMSAFNKFVSINTKLQSGLTFVYSEIMMTVGALFNPGITLLEASEGDSSIAVSWPISLAGDARADDVAHCVVYNATRDVFMYSAPVARSVGTVEVIDPNLALAEVLHVWLFFIALDNSKSSDSVYGTTVVVA